MIPAGWRIAKLGQIAKFISGGTPSRSAKAYWNGDIPWLSAKDLKYFWLVDSQEKVSSDGIKHGTVLIPKDTVMILVRGMTLMKDVPIGITTRPMAFNQDVKALIPADEAHADFLAYALTAAKQVLLSYVEQAGHGTGRMPTELLQNHTVLLPPLSEQRTIAAILSTWDRAIEQTTRLIEAKRQLKKGLLQQLMTGKRRLDGFENSEWRRMKLGEVGVYRRGVSYNPDTDLRTVDSEETVRLLRSGNISDSGLLRQGIHIVDSSRIRPEQILQSGDVVVCIANGSRALVGKAARFESEDDIPYVVGAFCTQFRPRGNQSPPYIALLFETVQYRQWIGKLLAGSSINNLRPSDIASFTILMPALLEERNRISALFTAAERETNVLIRYRDALQVQKQGVMQRLLIGQVRAKVS